MATDNLSADDKEFLAKCEEELKDRFTANDVEYMKVFNAQLSKPPIMENWRGSQNRRFNNRRFHPYNNSNWRRNQDRGSQDRGYQDHARGYQDRSYEDRSHDDRRHGHGSAYADNRNRNDYQPYRGRY